MKKIAFVLLCVIIMLQLSGCWNRREPTKLALMDSAIYDMKEDNSYRMVIDVVNTGGGAGGESSGGGESKNVQVTGEGKSIPEATRDLSSNMDRKIYVAHNRVVFLTEKFAKNAIGELLDYFLRDHEYRQSQYMVVLKGEKPETIYEAPTGLTDSIGSYFEGIVKSQSAVSDAVFVTVLEFARDYYLNGKEPVASVVEVKEDTEDTENTENTENTEDKPKYKITNEGLAAFKGNKLIGYMNAVEARSYNFITNKFKGAFISIPSEKEDTDSIVFEVLSSKSDIKTSIKEEKVTIAIKLNTKLALSQYGEKGDTTNEELLENIEERFNKKIKDEITAAIKKAQVEFESDIFGFGLYFHIDNPEKWKDIKDKWNDYFAKANVTVEVKSSVYVVGEMKKSFILEED